MDNLEKFDRRNPFLFWSIFIPMSACWMITALPILISAFSVGQPCDQLSNCTVGSLRAEVSIPNLRNFQFELIGDRSHLADLSTTAYMTGNLFGAAAILRVADTRGRRPVAIVAMGLLGAFGLVAAICPDIYTFIAVRFVQGVCFPPTGITSFVLAYESLPRYLRGYVTLSFGLFWVLGYCLVAPLAFLLPYWRHMMIGAAVPSLLTALLYYLVVPESFHFLVANRRTAPLQQWLQRANGNRPKVTETAESIIAAHHCRLRVDGTHGKSIFVELAAHRVLLIYTLVLSYLWLCDTFVYYGLSLFSSDLAGDKYVNYVLSGLIEAPSYAVSPYLLNRLGRRLFVGGSHLLAASAFFVSIFVEIPSLSLVLWLVGKFGVSCAFTSLFVYGSEVFPTGVRSGCIGMCEIVARFGGAVAPAVHSSGALYAPLPRIFFTVVAALGGVLTFVLPETRRRPLPDSAIEAEASDETVEEETSIDLAPEKLRQ